jgi:hypothetical protein
MTSGVAAGPRRFLGADRLHANASAHRARRCTLYLNSEAAARMASRSSRWSARYVGDAPQ